jgi:acyl dehydratase
MADDKSVLTDEIRALIGVEAERVEASLWGIEKEDLRRFTQAIMDPDPRYWDEEFAKTTKFGEIITPPIYCTYLGRKTPPGADDPITRAFRENPTSDGIGGVEVATRRGGLPQIPTHLKRVMNAGNEIELYKYPTLGDRIFSQAKIADIRERVGRDGSHMLIITTETTFTNQDGEVLCIQRASTLRR